MKKTVAKPLSRPTSSPSRRSSPGSLPKGGRGKLLFVITEDWVFWSHRAALASAAKAQGWEILLACRFEKHLREVIRQGIRPIPLEMSRGSVHPWKVLKEAMQLAKILRKEEPRLVHCVGLRSMVIGSIAARLAGSEKMVHSLTGLGHLFAGPKATSLPALSLKALLPWLLKQQLVIVQNREDFRWLKGLGVAKSHLRLIRGSGVDPRVFRPRRPPAGPPIAMFPARLVMDKGLGEFIEAARLLKKKGVPARFVLVGRPDPQNPTSVSEKDLRAWSKNGTVEIWGYQQRMEKVIPKAAVVCLPSYREGLPRSLLEGMACGLPCVATRTSGCREAVRHGDNGLLVPVRNSQALAGALWRILRDRKARLRMGRRGRQRAEREFSEHEVVAKTLDLYRKISPHHRNKNAGANRHQDPRIPVESGTRAARPSFQKPWV